MRRIFKWAGWILGGILGLLVVAWLGVYLISSQKLNKTYAVEATAVTIPSGETAVAEGQRQFFTHGCIDCHDTDGAGKAVIDDSIMGRVTGANLTPGQGGIGQTFTDLDWVRAIRHGLGPDGKPLVIMPSQEYNKMNDEDLGYLIAYLKSLPPVDRTPPDISVGPVARVLIAGNFFPILPAESIAHSAPRPVVVAKGPTAEYGHYLASQTCMGCHGEGLSGGPIPGVPSDPPYAKNLTPDKATGLGSWDQAAFERVLREGQRPDGTAVNPAKMPWPAFKYLTDEEITAIWLYLQSVPAQPYGNR